MFILGRQYAAATRVKSTINSVCSAILLSFAIRISPNDPYDRYKYFSNLENLLDIRDRRGRLLDTCHFLVNCVTKGPINECVLIIYYPLYRSCKCSGGNSFIISGCASMYCRIVVLLSARYEWSIKFLCASCPNLIEARIQCLKYTRHGSNVSSQIFSTPQRPYLKDIRTLFIIIYSV